MTRDGWTIVLGKLPLSKQQATRLALGMPVGRLRKVAALRIELFYVVALMAAWNRHVNALFRA